MVFEVIDIEHDPHIVSYDHSEIVLLDIIYNNIDKWELFDLQEDPMEMNNLYGKTGYENITHQLEKELIRLQKQYQDTNAMSFNKQLIHE